MEYIESAGRLIHAVTVADRGSLFFEEVYNKVNCKLNALLSFWYLRQFKTLAIRVQVLKDWRNILVKGGVIMVDSGIFTLMNNLGMVGHDNVSIGILNKRARKKAKEGFSQLTQFVDEYAELLEKTEGLWDWAFDFDCDLFLSPEDTDLLHERMIQRGVPRRRIIKVFHPLGRDNSTEWLLETCRDPRYDYFSIKEDSGRKTKPTASKLVIDLTHRHGKKIHALMSGSKPFLDEFAVDTGDTSTHLVGGRFGTLFTPIGAISFARNTEMSGHKTHWSKLSTEEQIQVVDWIHSNEYSLDETINIPYPRNAMNIRFMNKFWDLPYEEKTEAVRPLFTLG